MIAKTTEGYPQVYVPQPKPKLEVTDVQSYTLVILDVFFETMSKREPFFANYIAKPTRMVPVQPNLIPYLGVYLVDEVMTPDGDPNAGVIRFIHDARIGFSVIIKNNEQKEAQRTIDAAFWRIMNRLWRDPHIMNMINTKNLWDKSDNPDNTRIESIMRGVRRHNFGMAGANNETPVAELQYDVTCRYRTYWEPEF